MSSRFEPDDRFVDRLEWQLASELRRRERLKPAPGRVAVPRSVVALSLAAGVLLIGVAATKAADLIKDSWRRKVEIARLETEVKIKTAFLGLKKDRAAQAENQFSLGLVGEDEVLVAKLRADRAGADLERSSLDLAEVRSSGLAPRDELYAPLVGGRDFVGERLEIEKNVIRTDLELRRARTERALRQRVELGLVHRSALKELEASLAGQEAALEDIENRLALRRRFLAGEISAGDMEVRVRMSAAEKELKESRSAIESIRPRVDDLRVKAAAGLVTVDELKAGELGLSAAQAKADLALQEIEILKGIK
jgi:hypothetical protein